MCRTYKNPVWFLLAGFFCAWLSQSNAASAGITLSDPGGDTDFELCSLGTSAPDQKPHVEDLDAELPDMGNCGQPEGSNGGPSGSQAAQFAAASRVAPPLVRWWRFEPSLRWHSPALLSLAPPPRA